MRSEDSQWNRRSNEIEDLENSPQCTTEVFGRSLVTLYHINQYERPWKLLCTGFKLKYL